MDKMNAPLDRHHLARLTYATECYLPVLELVLLAEGHDAQGRHAQQRGDVRLVLVLLLQLVPLQLQVAACTHGLWLHGDSYYNTG